jgi:hypothetical protein
MHSCKSYKMIDWFNSRQSLHIYYANSSIIHLHICFGLCWHQSPKRGDWKGNRVKPFPNWFWWLNCPTQIIGLTSLFKIIYSTGAKGSTQTNQKNKLGLKRNEQKGNRRLPWSGAPDSVRCTRVHQLKLFTFRFPRRSSAIIHRTVRCATGLSGAPAEQRLSVRNGRLCKVNSTAVEVRAAVRGAPDCPVRHQTVRCHMRTEPPTVDQLQDLTTGWRGGAPDCLVRPSPAAFSNDYNLVGGYKYHPNRPLHSVGAQATFQVI